MKVGFCASTVLIASVLCLKHLWGYITFVFSRQLCGRNILCILWNLWYGSLVSYILPHVLVTKYGIRIGNWFLDHLQVITTVNYNTSRLL
jgi:hypothetical protein